MKKMDATYQSNQFLSPSPQEKKHQSGYATKPSLDISAPPTFSIAQQQPFFSNLIHLQTIDSNLYLGFGFSIEPVSPYNTQDQPMHPKVILSSETAKELLFSLAELFECTITPKRNDP
jgi:hypothetical protein